MPGSLNSYYRALKTCTVDESSWVSHTIRRALSAIPSDLADAPLFLSVDICNVRVDTAIYDLPPARTGKGGRPCKRGAQLSLDDFACTYSRGKFKVGHRCVKTKIFGDITVHAYVTVSESGARRLFICTAEPSEIRFGCASHTLSVLRDMVKHWNNAA